jgi:hypothetical protein
MKSSGGSEGKANAMRAVAILAGFLLIRATEARDIPLKREEFHASDDDRPGRSSARVDPDCAGIHNPTITAQDHRP